MSNNNSHKTPSTNAPILHPGNSQRQSQNSKLNPDNSQSQQQYNNLNPEQDALMTAHNTNPFNVAQASRNLRHAETSTSIANVNSQTFTRNSQTSIPTVNSQTFTGNSPRPTGNAPTTTGNTKSLQQMPPSRYKSIRNGISRFRLGASKFGKQVARTTKRIASRFITMTHKPFKTQKHKKLIDEMNEQLQICDNIINNKYKIQSLCECDEKNMLPYSQFDKMFRYAIAYWIIYRNINELDHLKNNIYNSYRDFFPSDNATGVSKASANVNQQKNNIHNNDNINAIKNLNMIRTSIYNVNKLLNKLQIDQKYNITKQNIKLFIHNINNAIVEKAPNINNAIVKKAPNINNAIVEKAPNINNAIVEKAPNIIKLN